jgi:hypothetical protein
MTSLFKRDFLWNATSKTSAFYVAVVDDAVMSDVGDGNDLTFQKRFFMECHRQNFGILCGGGGGQPNLKAKEVWGAKEFT